MDAPDKKGMSKSRLKEERGLIEFFGVLWKVTRIPLFIFGNPSLTLGSPTSHKVKVEGPFCPMCGIAYDFKDVNGTRHLMQNDNIGGHPGGKLHCSQCQDERKIDQDYHGERLISDYLREVQSRLD